jgi:hypothetical protein
MFEETVVERMKEKEAGGASLTRRDISQGGTSEGESFIAFGDEGAAITSCC